MSAKNAIKNISEQTMEDSATSVSEDLLLPQDDSQPKSEAARKRKQLREHITKIRRNGRLLKYRNPNMKSPWKFYKMFPTNRNSPEFRMILKYFIEPLAADPTFQTIDAETGAVNDLPLKEKLDIIFCAKTRDIIPAVFMETVKMPGKVWNPNDGTFRWPTTSEAKFQKGTPVFIRIDETMPDRIDIEHAHKEDLIFSLTRVEYQSILDHIREYCGKQRRLEV